MSRPPAEARTTAVVAYLTLIGALISMSMNAEPRHDFGRFHTRQAFGLHLSFILVMLFLSIVWFHPYAWIGFYICYFVLWIYGFIGALQGRKYLVPGIGPYFQQWFTFIP